MRTSAPKLPFLSLPSILFRFSLYSGNPARNGSLGADVLKHFQVTFDYEDGAMYLKKSRNFKKEFEHDMSGMELYTKQDRFFIGRIEPGSPADEAKLHTEDEILSLDFKKTQSYTLNELTEMLMVQDGRHVIVEVQRKDVQFVVVMKLKRRI